MPQYGKIFCWIYLINCKFVITNQIPGGTRRGLQLVKKVLTDFFDKLLSKLQNKKKIILQFCRCGGVMEREREP